MSLTAPTRPAGRGSVFPSFAAFVALSMLAATSGAALAARCGDDVDGSRVECACGDVVVSSVRLLPSDPVVTGRCAGDGLILRAPAGAPSLRVDLGGQTILGSGSGIGIRVLRGGEGGAVIVGGAEAETGVVSAFRTGLRASDLDAVGELRGVLFSGNARDGVDMRGLSATVSAVKAERNGRDGVRIGGRAARVEGIEASENGRFGVHVTARDAKVDRAQASANRRADFRGRAVAPGEGTSR
jgi:hypothetical protein